MVYSGDAYSQIQRWHRAWPSWIPLALPSQSLSQWCWNLEPKETQRTNNSLDIHEFVPGLNRILAFHNDVKTASGGCGREKCRNSTLQQPPNRIPNSAWLNNIKIICIEIALRDEFGALWHRLKIGNTQFHLALDRIGILVIW